MPMHTWSEHVVHVELLSEDDELARTAGRFLEQRFRAQDVEVNTQAGALRVHSEPGRKVSAAEVALAMLDAGVRVHALHERVEWSVADV